MAGKVKRVLAWLKDILTTVAAALGIIALIRHFRQGHAVKPYDPGDIIVTPEPGDPSEAVRTRMLLDKLEGKTP